MNQSRHPGAHLSSVRPRMVVDPTRVVPADIERLDVIHALLGKLNDPRASAQILAPFIEAFPPLKARIVQTFATRRPNHRASTLAAMIVGLGNRQIEAVLLELLEDLTFLRAELEEPTATR
ncbi:MAG: hypothetical protein ABI461_13990 [Polyangiaceae bacterium]